MVSVSRLQQIVASAVGGGIALLALRSRGKPEAPPSNRPPVANFSWSPSNPALGETVTFDGSASMDQDGAVVNWEWDIGGTQRFGEIVEHSFGSAGNVDVTLTVTDDDGATGFTTRTVSVGDVANTPPTADFSWSPTNPSAGDQVTFDASDSSDPDGTIASYEWTVNNQTLTGQSVTVAFDAAGDYDVQLTVVDDDGASDSLVQTVSVGETNSPPTADFTWSPADPVAGEEVTLDASGSSDPDGTIASYEWAVNNQTLTGAVVTTTFDVAGNYDVQLTVTDDEGATGTLTQTISVGETANSPPTASFTWSPGVPTAGETVTFDGTGSSDSDGTIAAYEWTIEGSTFSGPTVTHTFSQAGSYDVQLTVTDDDGATGSLTRTVSVDPVSSAVGLGPTADFSWSPVNPTIGEAVTFDASDSSSAGTIANYEWSIDGQTMTGVQVTHTFSENVREAVTLTITDGQGNTDTISQTLLVGGCPTSTAISG